MATIFDDLPLGMKSEDGGTVLYVCNVPHSLMLELEQLTSDWSHVLYLNAAESVQHSALNNLSRVAQRMIHDAHSLGYEFLAFRAVIEAGMIVYRDDQGEIFPSVVRAERDLGIAINVSPDGHVTMLRPGIYTATPPKNPIYMQPPEDQE